MSDSKRNIPHFAYVEELDVTELETLRRHLNTSKRGARYARLTYLPFLVAALVRVLREYPAGNALYDSRARGDRAPSRGPCRHRYPDSRGPQSARSCAMRKSLSLWELARRCAA